MPTVTTRSPAEPDVERVPYSSSFAWALVRFLTSTTLVTVFVVTLAALQ